MHIRLSPQLAERVRSLMGDHHYDAEELISIGLAMVEVVLREKYQDGNEITIVTPDGQIAGEFQIPLPNKINSTARMYLESVFTNGSPP